MTAPRDYARFYLDQKWVPVPIAQGEKGPKFKDWQHTKHTEAEARIATDFPENAPRNIGVILGRRSEGLVDWDADCQEAIAFAPLFLPPTVMFGRASKPRSHYLYISDVVSPIPLKDPMPKDTEFGGKMVLEVRTNGQQTVFPGSVHPSGEAIEFDPETPELPLPARIDPAVLAAASHTIFALCQIARYWPKGGRHDAQLALAGSLLSAGWSEELVLETLCTVCRLNGDEDRPKREATVRSTAKALAEGGKVKQWGTLKGVLPPRVWDSVHASLRLADEADATDLVTQTPPPDQDIFADTAARALSVGGPQARLATGIKTLDAAFRGGIRRGSFIAVGGAPGAGKTTLVVQWATQWAQQGIPVVILACDEEADGLQIRVGQVIGLDRDALEAGDPASRNALSTAFVTWKTFAIVDSEHAHATIETLAAILASIGPGVLILDSLQTAPLELPPKDGTAKARADAVVALAKWASKKYGHIVIATTELSRGAYRSQDSAEAIDDLAAAKESGAIEYGVAALLIMRSVKGCQGLVEVTVPKNRFGANKPTFKLSLNYQRAVFTEATVHEAAAGTFGTSVSKAALRGEMLLYIRNATEPLKSASDVAKMMHKRKGDVMALMKELLGDGTVFFENNILRVREGA